MKPKHKSLLDLWCEWHGEAPFYDKHGGVVGRDEKFGTKWRKGMNPQQYSRTKRVVDGIMQKAKMEGKTCASAAVELDVLFQDEKCSVGKMVEAMKEAGLLEKKKPRGRKRKVNEVAVSQ